MVLGMKVLEMTLSEVNKFMWFVLKICNHGDSRCCSKIVLVFPWKDMVTLGITTLDFAVVESIGKGLGTSKRIELIVVLGKCIV